MCTEIPLVNLMHEPSVAEPRQGLRRGSSLIRGGIEMPVCLMTLPRPRCAMQTLRDDVDSRTIASLKR